MDYIEHVVRAMKGDIKSYEYLVSHFQDMAISYAYSILHDFQSAEDAAQEAFILLYRNIKSIKEPKAFISWLRKLVFTCCGRIIRKTKPQIALDDAEEPIDHRDDPSIISEETEKVALVRQALLQLNKGQKEVFLLHYVFEKSYDEIANDLCISNSAVANRLYSGKKKLKNILLSSMINYLEEYVMNKEAFTKKVIDNIARLYEVKSENYMFDGCMHSAMVHLNENEAFDYAFFAGVTGDLFTQIWCTPKWQYNDSYSTVCRDSQLPIKTAFDACGYEYEYVREEEIKKSKAKYVKKIVASIDKGLPVLTFGIVGPPICSIICGYDENGDVLMGWAQFQDECKEIEPNGYFRKRNGLDESKALLFFGDKKDAPSPSDSIQQSIMNIPKFATMQPTDNVCFGKQAFDAWADSLLCDEDFKDESMLDGPADTYGSCMVLIGTNMHYINSYLNRAIELCPDMKDQIEKLQQKYTKVREALESLVEFQGGYFFDKNRLLDRNFRENFAGHVREIGSRYMEAALVFNSSDDDSKK